jgi:hypothetical protein
MSADNFSFVKLNRNGQWDVWPNLSASCDTHTQILSEPPGKTFDDRNEAVTWAEQQGYTEYGVEVDDGSPPDAPGFYWAFKQGGWQVMQYHGEDMWYEAGSDDYCCAADWGIEMWEGPIAPPPSSEAAAERKRKALQPFRDAIKEPHDPL